MIGGDGNVRRLGAAALFGDKRAARREMATG